MKSYNSNSLGYNCSCKIIVVLRTGINEIYVLFYQIHRIFLIY